MRDVALRPIRPSGWAFPLPVLNQRTCPAMCGRLCVLLILVVGLLAGTVRASAQHVANEHAPNHMESAVSHEAPHAHTGGGWEGSTQGIAYSEFNHRFAGLFILLIGLVELTHAVRSHSPFWTRMVLPGSLGVIGVFLLVWSDHEAWPIGSLSFVQTFFGQDHEILQHKMYGVLAVIVSMSEIFRRADGVKHPAWGIPLPLFAVLGGLMLFLHSHGIHPAAQKIELNHAIMGGMSVSAGTAKSAAAWASHTSSRWAKACEVVWAGLIFFIGVLLLVYSE